MKEKIRDFMIGRYGVDALGKFTLGAALVLMLISTLFRSSTLNLLSFLLVALCYFRMFSKNYTKRFEENQRFLEIKRRAEGIFRRERSYLEQRRTHHIYRCPSCGQKIRIPRGKGKICITCPKCHEEFVKRS